MAGVRYEIDIYNNNSNKTENEDITILRERQVHPDKDMKVNKPDIIIKNRKDKSCTLIHKSVPSERNVSVQEVQKF